MCKDSINFILYGMEKIIQIEDGQILIAERLYGWKYKEEELIGDREDGTRSVNHLKFFLTEPMDYSNKKKVHKLIEIKYFDVHSRREWWTGVIYEQESIFDRIHKLGMTEEFEMSLATECSRYTDFSYGYFLLTLKTIDLFNHLVRYLKGEL